MQPDGGEIRMDGRAYNGSGPKRDTLIGVAPQEIVIWGALTCMEQLTFMGLFYGASRKNSRNRAALLLESFGLSAKKDRLAKTLSGGMQRRLNIALALMHSPSVLILDEPQAGLDPQSRVLVRDYIAQLRLRTTVILCTHDMEEAEKLTDRVCIIDKGQRLALDTPSNLKKAFAKPTVSRPEKRSTDSSFITLEDVFIGMTGRGLRE
jgi:ABC-2 type transport system ATP-binding protein